MPLPLLAIAQGVGTGLNFLNNYMNKPKPFGDTAYGKRLKTLSEQGTFSGAAKSNILGGVGKETGNVAQQAKVSYKGRLISQGMGGSIAGQAKLADIDVQRMNKMGETAKGIETENELSKVQYGNEYAQAASQYGQQRQDYNRNMLTGLVQGTVGALGTYAQGLQQESRYQDTLGLKQGEIENKGKYYDYLSNKANAGNIPEITTAKPEDISNWIYTGKSEAEQQMRINILYEKYKNAGLLEQFGKMLGKVQ